MSAHEGCRVGGRNLHLDDIPPRDLSSIALFEAKFKSFICHANPIRGPVEPLPEVGNEHRYEQRKTEQDDCRIWLDTDEQQPREEESHCPCDEKNLIAPICELLFQLPHLSVIVLEDESRKNLVESVDTSDGSDGQMGNRKE